MQVKRERVIGLGLYYAYAPQRDIFRGIARFAESRPEWHFVSLRRETGRSARGTLKHFDAAIVAVTDHKWCDVLLQSRARVVNISAWAPGLPIPRVGVDNGMVGQMAAQHFLQLGLRSFAFVGSRRALFSREREQGLRGAVEAARCRLATYYIHSHDHFDPLGSLQSTDRELHGWLRSLPRPAGVFTPNDQYGAEVIEACRNIGLRVPEDIAVLGVNNDEVYCRMARPPLSSVRVPSDVIGWRAAALVDQLLHGARSLRRDVLIPPLGVMARRSTDVLAIDDCDVVKAVRFIRENCQRPLRVSDVLKEVQVSRRSLESRVLDALGITLGGEIRRTRLERAKMLLAQTEMSIADVAAQSGFTDFRHLAVTFRHELRKTPTQYRREVGCSSAARDPSESREIN